MIKGYCMNNIPIFKRGKRMDLEYLAKVDALKTKVLKYIMYKILKLINILKIKMNL